MSVLDKFGVGADDLLSQLGKEPPKLVNGRVCHIDADFTAYIVACDTVAELRGEKPMRDMGTKRAQVKDFAEMIARQAGAEKYVLHITPSASTKGGRADQVVQQEYQASRADKEAPRDLAAIRGYMGENLPCVVHMDQEADDGLAQANYNAEDRNLSVIASKDKDLRMVPGLHLNMDKYELVEVPHGDFGYLEVDDTKSTKKVVGYGPAFFFAQCIMGDQADWIKGLPFIPARQAMKMKPTQAFIKDRDKYLAVKGSGTPEEEAAKEKVLNYFRIPPRPCGQMAAYNCLKDIDNVKDAFHLVKTMFENLEKEHGHAYYHWRTTEQVTPGKAMVGDMQALWMRRNKNPNDVLNWLRENM